MAVLDFINGEIGFPRSTGDTGATLLSKFLKKSENFHD